MVDVNCFERSSIRELKIRKWDFLWAVISDINEMLKEVGVDGITIDTINDIR